MFPIQNGLKQDALLPLLINFALGNTTGRVKLEGTHQFLVPIADDNLLGKP
jgi:hypothetical protein